MLKTHTANIVDPGFEVWHFQAHSFSWQVNGSDCGILTVLAKFYIIAGLFPPLRFLDSHIWRFVSFAMIRMKCLRRRNPFPPETMRSQAQH